MAGYISGVRIAVKTIPGAALPIRIRGLVCMMRASTALPAAVPTGPLIISGIGFGPKNEISPPATRRNTRATVTLMTVWVPNSKLIVLARIPIVKYLRKPKQAAIDRAKGAES